MAFERTLHRWALLYLICGMSLGLVMAFAHHDISYLSSTHVLLAGCVLALLYCVIHNLWLICALPMLHLPVVVQCLLHLRQAGALTMFSALLLMFGNLFLDEHSEPMFAMAALTLLLGTASIVYINRLAEAHHSF